jgi:hypothetical protein
MLSYINVASCSTVRFSSRILFHVISYIYVAVTLFRINLMQYEYVG